jgi:hypothetical protein
VHRLCAARIGVGCSRLSGGTDDETATPRLGSTLVTARLARVVFVEALRAAIGAASMTTIKQGSGHTRLRAWRP